LIALYIKLEALPAVLDGHRIFIANLGNQLYQRSFDIFNNVFVLKVSI